MTSLIMSARAPIQRNEEDVRSTLDPVDHAAPAAAEDTPPDYNQFQAYPDNHDGVVRSHQENGAFTATEKYAPDWAGRASESGLGTESVNHQVASSGTAAARERAGMFGHGTMERTESIEPQVREGAAFGADIFLSNRMGVNPTGGDYMTPQVGDPGMAAVAAAYGKTAARDAAQAALYGNWLGALQGNV